MPQSKDLFGHPKGLYVLFLTEMWERFSFYGMRTLLVYYMIKHLMFEQETASHIFGLYAGFAYFTPIFGGYLADKYFGKRKTVIVGGVIMAIGHFMMAFESLFYPALIFIILGNGAFKPNISTQVGDLYTEDDPRRDSAFSIFYVGINLGAFLAPLICGYLGEVHGWHYGFAAAGVGMILGLINYIFGQKYLAKDQNPILNSKDHASRDLTTEERDGIIGLAVLCFFSIFFWAVYEQQSNTLALWADSYTNRYIFGGSWEMPATWFQSVNPAFIFLLTPVLTTLWTRQGLKGREPSSPTKMAMGCVFLSISFLVLYPAAGAHSSVTLASANWLFLSLFFATLGELYLSPVSLSLVTKVAPKHMASMLMGGWFISYFIGEYASGVLGMFWEKMPKGSFFLLMAAIAMAAAFGIILTLRPLKRVFAFEHKS